jgi:hypothetical protein
MLLQPVDDENRQIHALVDALSKAGFSPKADFRHGSIQVNTLPEFHGKLLFMLTIAMDDPFVESWDSLFEGCTLESGRIQQGAAHGAGIYSRKKAVERAMQEKWAALWSLYDAGIVSEAEKPICARWEEVTLP